MYLLDSCAVIAFLMQEEGFESVEACIATGECRVLTINYMEIYLDLLRRPELGILHQTAELERFFRVTEIPVIESIPVTVARIAAERKLEVTNSRDEHGRKRTISWTDCLVYAFAEENGLTLVTSDGEFSYLTQIHPNVNVQFFKQPGTR